MKINLLSIILLFLVVMVSIPVDIGILRPYIIELTLRFKDKKLAHIKHPFKWMKTQLINRKEQVKCSISFASIKQKEIKSRFDYWKNKKRNPSLLDVDSRNKEIRIQIDSLLQIKRLCF